MKLGPGHGQSSWCEFVGGVAHHEKEALRTRYWMVEFTKTTQIEGVTVMILTNAIRAFKAGYGVGQAVGGTNVGNGVTVQDGVNAVVGDLASGNVGGYLQRWKWSNLRHAFF